MKVAGRAVEQCPWYLRPFFWNQKRKYGQVLAPALVWARVPRLFLAVASLHGALERRRSPLDPVLRALVMARISQVNHCSFCLDLNSAVLARRAGSAAKVEALGRWANSTLFDARERAALEYAEAVTLPGRGVGDALAARVRQQFDDDALVELTALIAFQNLSSKFNSALGIPAQGFCRLPDHAPRR
jgi:AhpD family alkylhydroperoxidase